MYKIDFHRSQCKLTAKWNDIHFIIYSKKGRNFYNAHLRNINVLWSNYACSKTFFVVLQRLCVDFQLSKSWTWILADNIVYFRIKLTLICNFVKKVLLHPWNLKNNKTTSVLNLNEKICSSSKHFEAALNAKVLRKINCELFQISNAL